MDQLNFRISSALKNIIGKELITNKYVAIFELVKNAYDASAGKVEVIFEDDKIIIKDNGKGMSLEDVKDKWLFVGYSAKADRSENASYTGLKNKIGPRRHFAGAKWVGRFACDRLWSELILTTLKDEVAGKTEQISVFWDSFEEDPKKEFINISVQHETRPASIFSFEHGTQLEIRNLRESWEEADVNELKKHLSRLISPAGWDIEQFDIYLNFKGNEDKVENFIIEKIESRTTKIQFQFSEDGKMVLTELIDRGERIYKITEVNPYPLLANITVTILYLTRPSKILFTKEMGVSVTDYYGSILLYKNGFRVFPFWEPGKDLLEVDRRKAQGHARYLGNRELFGKIEINRTDDDFRETTSRDGWLIETRAYLMLKDAFKEFCLRRLELYVVDTLDWIYKYETGETINPEQRKANILDLINRLTKSKNYLSLEYWYKIEEKLDEQANRWYGWAKEDLIREAKKNRKHGAW